MEAMQQGRHAPSWWCADNPNICPLLWWCGPRGYVTSSILGVLAFGTLFCFICLVIYPMVESAIERIPSKVRNERGPLWFAWHVQSVVHASLVTYMALGPVYHFSFSSPGFQLDTPDGDVPRATREMLASIANGSHVFFCYLLVDTVVTCVRKDMTLDYFAHHVVFCFFCLLITYDCFAAYLAGWLLIMEISTIFLNGFSFFRNRLGYDHWLVKGFFGIFFISFLLFRLVGITYIAAYFSNEVYKGRVLFQGIPRWHLWLVCVALVAAVGIQMFWANAIVKKLIKVLRAGGHNNTNEDNPQRVRPEREVRPVAWVRRRDFASNAGS